MIDNLLEGYSSGGSDQNDTESKAEQDEDYYAGDNKSSSNPKIKEKQEVKEKKKFGSI